MGIARGIFVVDSHVHAQRHAFKFKDKNIKPDYSQLAKGMAQAEVYDNTDRLLYHMDRYGVDMCIIMPAFGMTNDLNAKIVAKYPDNFIAMCNAVKTYHRAKSGEEAWTIDAACRELDELLSTGLYQGGIGEGLLPDPSISTASSWSERFDQICSVMELAKKYKVPVGYHTGVLSGYGGARTQPRYNEWSDPLGAHEVAAAYPEVPIILQHGGVQGWWTTHYWEQCMHVAACHPNIYLETGLWWPELYEKALLDPNVGVERLIWGTDWGASIPQQWVPGFNPVTYADQCPNQGIPAHQIDVFGWSLRQLDKLDIPQDDLNLILGGNAVRLFKIEEKVPFKRLFKHYLK